MPCTIICRSFHSTLTTILKVFCFAWSVQGIAQCPSALDKCCQINGQQPDNCRNFLCTTQMIYKQDLQTKQQSKHPETLVGTRGNILQLREQGVVGTDWLSGKPGRDRNLHSKVDTYLDSIPFPSGNKKQAFVVVVHFCFCFLRSYPSLLLAISSDTNPPPG